MHNRLTRDLFTINDDQKRGSQQDSLTPGLPGMMQCHTTKFTEQPGPLSGFATNPDQITESTNSIQDQDEYRDQKDGNHELKRKKDCVFD